MKKHLLKTFLLTVMCVLGVVQGWAETYTGTVGFAAQNRITKNDDGTFTTANNAGNQYALALADLSALENIASASSVTVDFDVTIATGNRLYVGVGDKNTRGVTAGTSTKTTYDGNGIIMSFGTGDGNNLICGNTTKNDAFGKSLHVSLTLDRGNKAYSYTIASGGTVYFSGSSVSTAVDNATVVEAYSWNNNQVITISDVTYSYEYSAASFDYTIKAVDENGDDLKELASGTSSFAVQCYYPYMLNVNGKYYVAQTTSSFAVEATSLNPNPTVVYAEDTRNIAGYVEVETELSNCTSDGNANNKYSNGWYGHVNSGKKAPVATLAPGKYTAYAYLAERGDRGIYFRNAAEADNDKNELANMGTSKTSAVGVYSCEFTLNATTDVVLSGYKSDKGLNQSAGMDYVYIVKTGNATQDVTVTDLGYASYAPAFDIVVPAEEVAKVFWIKSDGIEGDVVHLTQIPAGTAVPFNTGLFVKAAQGTVTFQQATTTPEDFTENLLKGTQTDKSASEVNNPYVLGKSEDKAAICKFTGATLAAGKAYMEMPTTANIKSFILRSGDEATQVSEVSVAVEAEAEGKFIDNGMLVIKKFGKKFTAAGAELK